MFFQAVFMNMLILKPHFHLFWTYASMNCTHVSDIANHFIFGMGSINILWMLTADYDNLFYQILPRDIWTIGKLDFLARLPHFGIYFYILEYY